MPQSCCIVGGGPAGMVLSLLLSRQGIPVTLLESHSDFDREFRGDTLHPSTMELMDQLGYADDLLRLDHNKVETATMQTVSEKRVIADFRELKTRFPYITLMPQSEFLSFLAAKAEACANFTLRMGATAKKLIEEGGQVVGVEFRTPDGTEECRADLVVACDGRFSKIRKLAALEPVSQSPPMDVLWFNLPRHPDDGVDLNFRVNDGRVLIMLDRGDFWQIGYVILKGGYGEVKAAGMEAFHTSLRTLTPELSDRLDCLSDWSQVVPLNVEASRLRKWYRPGLLLIGDAAHVMSPVGGVGINYAIQDAVEAANVLCLPMSAGTLCEADLGFIQKQRQFPTRVIQWFQRVVQNRIIKASLDSNRQRPFRIPWFLRLPLVRKLPARLIGFGVGRVRLLDELVEPFQER